MSTISFKTQEVQKKSEERIGLLESYERMTCWLDSSDPDFRDRSFITGTGGGGWGGL